MESKNLYPPESELAPSSVRQKLVKAAGKLLAKKGPSSVSNRDIAKMASVNHGQIHHYFGSKKSLLSAAMSALADSHWNRTQKDGYSPLGLKRDQTYIMAVVRCAIDGEMDLATLSIRENISVPRQLLAKFIETKSNPKSLVDAKAKFAVIASIELSWSVLEGYIFASGDIEDHEQDDIRKFVSQFISQIINEITSLKDVDSF